MKRFQYGMENVLRIKYRLEDQAKNEYAQARRAYEEQLDKLNSLYAQRERYETHLKKCMMDRLDFNEIQITKNGIVAVDDAIKKQTRAVMLAQKRMDAAREKLNELRVERKTHETLKDHAFTEYKKDLQDEEQREVDGLVSFQFQR